MSKEVECPNCEGYGAVEHWWDGVDSRYEHTTHHEWHDCHVCHGYGYVEVDEEPEEPPLHTDADAPEWLEDETDDDPDENALRELLDRL